MPNFECAICGKSIINSMICTGCKKKFDPTDLWVQALIEQEKDWRNTNRRDDLHGLKTLSDYPIQSEEGDTDGWEIIYTDQTIKLEPVMTLSEMEQIDLLVETIEDYYRRKQAQTILDVMSKRAKLTPGEVNALGIYLRFDEKISSQESALHLRYRR